MKHALAIFLFALSAFAQEPPAPILTEQSPALAARTNHTPMSVAFVWSQSPSPNLSGIILLASTNNSTNGPFYTQQEFPATNSQGEMTNLNLSHTNYFFAQAINASQIKSALQYGTSVSGFGEQLWIVLGASQQSPDREGGGNTWTNLFAIPATNPAAFYRLGWQYKKTILP